MTPQDKYQKIMEVMSDKTFKIGLLVSPNGGDNEGIIFTYLRHYRYGDCAITNKEGVELSYDENELEIIGHPLHIGDVLDWCEKMNWFSSTDSKKQIQELVKLMLVWKDKRLPLSPTDEELVDYIYSLIA